MSNLPPTSLPPSGGIPPSGGFPPPQGFGTPPGGFPPRGGGFAPPPPPRGRRRGSGLGLVGGYLGFRLLMWVIGMVVSLGITAAVLFFGFGSNDVGSNASRDGFTTTAPAAITVPAAWPEGLAPPAGADLQAAVVSSAGTPQERIILTYEVDAELAAQGAAVRQQVEASGFTLVTEPSTTATVVAIVAESADRSLQASVTASPSQPGVVTVGMTIGPKL